MLKTNSLFNTLKLFIFLISLSVTAADITVPVGGSIQNAIDDVNASGGGTVTLAAGTFTVTSPLKIKSNVTLQGSGIYASTIATTQNIKIIEQSGYGLKNITIRNLTLKGTNKIDGGGMDIISYGTDHDTILISSVRCYNTGWGVHIKGAKNLIIENCDFSYNGTEGKEWYAHNMYLRRVYGATVTNSSFNHSTSANGINISYSEDIKIYDCEMIGNYFRGVRAADSDGYLVHNCIVTDNGNVGILANTEKEVTKNIDWQNNCSANNAVGFETKNGATGISKNNNSYGNDSGDYKLVSSVSQSGNISSSSKKCASSVEPEEPIIVEPETAFVPDPNKLYYLDVPVHNLRLGATGNSEDPYTTGLNTTGTNVEWKFVAKGNGYWHIQLASGSKPRIRTNNSEDADMQATSSSGGWTYYEITQGASAGTYFLTLPDAPANYKRLQIDNNSNVKMVEATRNGTWESFTITEVGGSTAKDIRLEAEDHDGMSGVQTEGTTDVNGGENVGWINNGDWLRFDDINLSGLSNMDARIACNFTGGTIEVRTGSTSGTLIGSISISNTGGNQSWVTKNTSVSNVSGTKDVFLVFKGGSGYLFNVNWIEFNNSSTSNKDVATLAAAEVDNVMIYPNPVEAITTIKNAANTVMYVYDVNGSIIFTTAISSDNETVDLGKLQTGIYYTEVVGQGIPSVVKLVKN